MNYFIIRNGQQQGPFTIDELRTMKLNADTPIWRQGEPNWRIASEINELQGYCSSNTPPPFTQFNFRSNNIGLFDEGPSGKSRGLAGLFAILLGGLGIHYFYIGKTTAGLLSILLTILTCGIWSIIMLIVGIKILCIRQEEFEEKYVNTPSNFPLF